MPGNDYSYKKLAQPLESIGLKDLSADPAEEQLPDPSPPPSLFGRHPKSTSLAVKMLVALLVSLSVFSLVHAVILDKRQATATPSTSNSNVPQYFQTTPEIFAGKALFETDCAKLEC